MTVKQLVEELSKMPNDARVINAESDSYGETLISVETYETVNGDIAILFNVE